jgi:hypothetical protein
LFFKILEGAFGRERRKCIPIIPHSLDFVIPLTYTFTRGHQRFLLADEKTKNNGRIISFASDAQLNHLFKSNYVFCDGTFSTVPSMFNQIYTFHGYKRSQGLENHLFLLHKLTLSYLYV